MKKRLENDYKELNYLATDLRNSLSKFDDNLYKFYKLAFQDLTHEERKFINKQKNIFNKLISDNEDKCNKLGNDPESEEIRFQLKETAVEAKIERTAFIGMTTQYYRNLNQEMHKDLIGEVELRKLMYTEIADSAKSILKPLKEIDKVIKAQENDKSTIDPIHSRSLIYDYADTSL